MRQIIDLKWQHPTCGEISGFTCGKAGSSRGRGVDMWVNVGGVTTTQSHCMQLQWWICYIIWECWREQHLFKSEEKNPRKLSLWKTQTFSDSVVLKISQDRPQTGVCKHGTNTFSEVSCVYRPCSFPSRSFLLALQSLLLGTLRLSSPRLAVNLKFYHIPGSLWYEAVVCVWGGCTYARVGGVESWWEKQRKSGWIEYSHDL